MKSSETLVREMTWKAICADLGIAETESNFVQLVFLLDALKIFDERNRRYKDQWKETGWRGALYDVVKKARRLFTQFRAAEPTPGATDDDAYDMINFCVFFLRGKAEGNEWGIWEYEARNSSPKQ